MKRSKKLVAGIMAMAIMMSSAIAMAATPASAAGKEVTVYFQNTQNWSSVYAYLWAGSGNIKGTAAWPGQKMAKVAGADNWYEVKYTAGAPFNVIFNDNAQPKPHQTADHTPKNLAADKDAYWFVPGGAAKSNDNGLTPAGTAITVYTEAVSQSLLQQPLLQRMQQAVRQQQLPRLLPLRPQQLQMHPRKPVTQTKMHRSLLPPLHCLLWLVWVQSSSVKK